MKSILKYLNVDSIHWFSYQAEKLKFTNFNQSIQMDQITNYVTKQASYQKTVNVVVRYVVVTQTDRQTTEFI